MQGPSASSTTITLEYFCLDQSAIYHSCLVFAGISQRNQSLPLPLTVGSSMVVSCAGSTALAYTSPTSPGERERYYKVDTRTSAFSRFSSRAS